MRLVLVGAFALGGPAHAFQLWGTGPLAGASVQVMTDVEMRYHQSMLDDQYARKLASSANLGIAEALVNQLSGSLAKSGVR